MELTLNTSYMPRKQLCLVAGLAGVVFATGLAMGKYPLPTLAVVLGSIACAAVFIKPRYAVWMVLAMLFFGNRVEFPELIFWGRYLPTLGVACFVGVMAIRMSRDKDRPAEGREIVIWYVLFAALLLLSAIYNRSYLHDLFLSLVTNLRYPIFFFMLINSDLDSAFYMKSFKAFVALTLIQIPASIVQFTMHMDGDWLAGTMGSNQALIAVVLISQSALLAWWLVKKKPLYLAAAIALIVPVILADVQMGYIAFPAIVALTILYHNGFRKILRTAMFTSIVLGLAGLVLFGMASSFSRVERFLEVFSKYRLDWNDPLLASGGSLGRLTILPLSFPLLTEDPLRLMMGFGPEAAQGGLLTATFVDASCAETSSMGTVCQELAKRNILCREPQSFKAMMEFGLLGTMLYLYPMLMIWRRISAQLHEGQSQDSRFLWLFFESVSFLFLMLEFWYVNVWRSDWYSFPFWFVAAAAWTLIRERAADSPASVKTAQRPLSASALQKRFRRKTEHVYQPRPSLASFFRRELG